MKNSIDILNNAKKYGYAVPQFNINNLEWTKYILEECQKEKSPVILGASEGAIKYMGGYNVVFNIVNSLIIDLNITIPVALHLDHGSSVESCKRAIDAGFSSVMIDASNTDLNTNIKVTKEVVIYAKGKNVSIEAEIGSIGGVEDNTSGNLIYAKIEDCIKICEDAEINSLAPGVGSVHGFYKGEPKINFELINNISKKVQIPIVLHGGSGLSDQIIWESIKNGISKININTELQFEWSKAIRKFLESEVNVYDPRKIIESGESAIKEVIRKKIILFGSNNRI